MSLSSIFSAGAIAKHDGGKIVINPADTASSSSWPLITIDPAALPAHQGSVHDLTSLIVKVLDDQGKTASVYNTPLAKAKAEAIIALQALADQAEINMQMFELTDEPNPFAEKLSKDAYDLLAKGKEIVG